MTKLTKQTAIQVAGEQPKEGGRYQFRDGCYFTCVQVVTEVGSHGFKVQARFVLVQQWASDEALGDTTKQMMDKFAGHRNMEKIDVHISKFSGCHIDVELYFSDRG